MHLLLFAAALPLAAVEAAASPPAPVVSWPGKMGGARQPLNCIYYTPPPPFRPCYRRMKEI